MSKLSKANKFFDLSDYGRQPANFLAQKLKYTKFTPIHVTLLFGVAGLFAIYFILMQQFYLAAIFIILKSIIDGADGELARIKKKPSYTGRYLDSIFDIVLNFLFLMAICYVSTTTFYYTIIAFIAVQLQGTLYNYYYVILRNKSVGADTTSKIFEYKAPKALLGESQKAVNILYKLFNFLYSLFDKSIHLLDKEAPKVKYFPNWFMTLVSLYGLGFQLLIISVMLCFNLNNFIVPFFIIYSLLFVVFVGIRKLFIHTSTKMVRIV